MIQCHIPRSWIIPTSFMFLLPLSLHWSRVFFKTSALMHDINYMRVNKYLQYINFWMDYSLKILHALRDLAFLAAQTFRAVCVHTELAYTTILPYCNCSQSLGYGNTFYPFSDQQCIDIYITGPLNAWIWLAEERSEVCNYFMGNTRRT